MNVISNKYMDNKKNCGDRKKYLRQSLKQSRWHIVVAALFMVIFSIIVTYDLPSPQCYETKYEARTTCDELVGGLQEQASEMEGDVKVWADKTSKITIRVRHEQKEVTENEARQLFVSLYNSCDTVEYLDNQSAHLAHYTYNRWLLILLSTIAAVILAFVFVLFRAYGELKEDCE